MTRPNHDQRWKSPLKIHSEDNLDNDVKRHMYHDVGNARARNYRLNNSTEIIDSGYTPMSPELQEATEAIGFITEHLKWEDRYGSVRFVLFVALRLTFSRLYCIVIYIRTLIDSKISSLQYLYVNLLF